MQPSGGAPERVAGGRLTRLVGQPTNRRLRPRRSRQSPGASVLPSSADRLTAPPILVGLVPFPALSRRSKVRLQNGLLNYLISAGEPPRRNGKVALETKSDRYSADARAAVATAGANASCVRSISSKVRPLGSKPNAQNPITPRIYHAAK